jgi:hypothetical protein
MRSGQSISVYRFGLWRWLSVNTKYFMFSIYIFLSSIKSHRPSYIFINITLIGQFQRFASRVQKWEQRAPPSRCQIGPARKPDEPPDALAETLLCQPEARGVTVATHEKIHSSNRTFGGAGRARTRLSQS